MVGVGVQRRETDALEAIGVVGVELHGNISGDPGGRREGSEGSGQACFRHLLAQQGIYIYIYVTIDSRTQKWMKVDELQHGNAIPTFDHQVQADFLDIFECRTSTHPPWGPAVVI